VEAEADGGDAVAWAMLKLAESQNRCVARLRHLGAADAEITPIAASAAEFHEFAAHLVAERAVEADADLVDQIRQQAARGCPDCAVAWEALQLAENIDRCTAALRRLGDPIAAMKLGSLGRQFGEFAARHRARAALH
jgi:hypothetical protein